MEAWVRNQGVEIWRVRRVGERMLVKGSKE